MKKNLFKFSLLTLLATSLTISFPSCDNSEDSITKQEQIQDDNITINSGYLPLPTEQYEKIPLAKKISLTKSYPSTTILSCPPILNQGGEGSCVSWGVGYAARSISWHNLYGGSYNYSSNIFSPEYIYNQIKVSDCQSGSYVTDGLDLITNQGVCTWNDMPYTDVSCDLYPNDYQAQQAVNYKTNNYTRLSINLDAFKDQLAAGKPIVVAGSVYRDFYNLSYGDIQTRARGKSYGGHCYCCVGYDDSKQAFLIMNSWGTNWGTDGFGWISYDIMGRVWQEAYVLNEY
ncbi:C1 family peptidase [Ancylomarina longa]|uniref:Peptidase C1 n=1 Tax=Ancylomarina longa TaxID=2487017 RepID=A0A434AW76_9BACT|nr:C1 family peptidase [Ancylomarina longa]RUT78635.1 peptidase C1 [Ancylomarina longa]